MQVIDFSFLSIQPSLQKMLGLVMEYPQGNNELTSYVGAVFLVPVSKAAKNEKTTVSILCAANSPGNTQPPVPNPSEG